jgi:hypothetical protein
VSHCLRGACVSLPLLPAPVHLDLINSTETGSVRQEFQQKCYTEYYARARSELLTRADSIRRDVSHKISLKSYEYLPFKVILIDVAVVFRLGEYFEWLYLLEHNAA